MESEESGEEDESDSESDVSSSPYVVANINRKFKDLEIIENPQVATSSRNPLVLRMTRKTAAAAAAAAPAQVREVRYLPYALVPGMDTKARVYQKALRTLATPAEAATEAAPASSKRKASEPPSKRMSKALKPQTFAFEPQFIDLLGNSESPRYSSRS